MPFEAADLRREVLLAANKALSSMSREQIATALNDIATEIATPEEPVKAEKGAKHA
jgi:hypothetical protein